MDTIIQQIALELVEKITKMAFETKISDIDALASDVLLAASLKPFPTNVTIRFATIKQDAKHWGSS